MGMFKVGDVVKCTKDVGVYLQYGELYTVESVDSDSSLITVENVKGTWYEDRFVYIGPAPLACSHKHMQIGGDHYKNMKIQPVDYIHANNLGFIEGCVIKYISRYKTKNGKQDLEKARHFINMLIELEYPSQSGPRSGDLEQK